MAKSNNSKGNEKQQSLTELKHLEALLKSHGKLLEAIGKL